MNWFWACPFPLSFSDPVYEVVYQVAWSGATVEGCFSEAVRRNDGSVEGWRGNLIIKDRGEPSQASIRRVVYVCNGSKLPCELPKDAGSLVGRITSENGKEEWYVFTCNASRPVLPSSHRPPARTARPAAASATSSAANTPGAASAAPSPSPSSPAQAPAKAESLADAESLWPL